MVRFFVIHYPHRVTHSLTVNSPLSTTNWPFISHYEAKTNHYSSIFIHFHPCSSIHHPHQPLTITTLTITPITIILNHYQPLNHRGRPRLQQVVARQKADRTARSTPTAREASAAPESLARLRMDRAGEAM